LRKFPLSFSGSKAGQHNKITAQALGTQFLTDKVKKMNFAIIGYGRMGKEIERIAQERGHKIGLIIDISNQADLNQAKLENIDVAIEFTRPETALSNYNICFSAGVPVVSGTTGWLADMPEVEKKCQHGAGFFYASNFSLGVNIFFELNRKLSELMAPYVEYDVAMEEIHHTNKLDAPSGTAITLAEGIIENLPRKDKWVLNNFASTGDLQITAKRLGTVPGTHTVTYDSAVDEIEISHRAKGRQGFALGAVLAAEFLAGRNGMFGMSDLLRL
jgi:4-hydroxy-tetrahydrodipicolinate reductase